jgi:hypothetical protein
MADLAAWNSFYVILGSSAGALTGLQFVVMTLIAEKSPPRSEEAGPAFATPTIVHFGAVLLLSAVISAPWQDAAPVAAIWGLMGIIGVVYICIVAKRMKIQTAYTPNAKDWLFYFLLPLAAYALIALCAYGALSHMTEALFGIGAAALLLMFTGIHNAWDSIVYLVLFTTKHECDE